MPPVHVQLAALRRRSERPGRPRQPLAATACREHDGAAPAACAVKPPVASAVSSARAAGPIPDVVALVEPVAAPLLVVTTCAPKLAARSAQVGPGAAPLLGAAAPAGLLPVACVLVALAAAVAWAFAASYAVVADWLSAWAMAAAP